jgi:O-antigen/teichoic acid export membrane protein
MSDVGLYSFGMSVSMAPALLVLGFNQMWQPILFENLKNNNYKFIKTVTKNYIIVLSIAFLGFNLFIEELFFIIIDRKYHESVRIIYLISLAIYFSGLVIIGTGHLTYKKNLGRISLLCSIAVIINITLNIFLTKHIGIIGASVSFLSAYLLFFFMVTYNMRKSIFRINEIKEFIYPIVYVAFAATILFLISFSKNNLEVNIISISIKLFILIIFIIYLLITGVYKINEFRSIFKYFKISKSNE